MLLLDWTMVELLRLWMLMLVVLVSPWKLLGSIKKGVGVSPLVTPESGSTLGG